MSYEREIERTLSALRLDAARLSDAQLGALALVRATSELVRQCPDESDLAHPVRTLLRWVQVVEPRCAVRDARRVMDGAHPTRDPLWLASLHFDPRLSKAFPPALVVAGLVATVPPGHSHVDGAWSYIQLSAQRTGVSDDDLECLRGWLASTASESIMERVDRDLHDLASTNTTCAAVVAVLREHASRASVHSAPQGAPPFLQARTQVIEQVALVLHHAEALHIDRTKLLNLRDYAARDYFRIAVLGEFNRGKSTLVNALVEVPDLMPADLLPCTSALTELRYGSQRCHFVRDPETQEYVGRDESSFRGDVSQAAASTSTRAGAEAEAPAVLRWRVFLPSHFLREDFVELIDSPGLGEDPARDYLAKEEALRADAAILVFNATAIGSLKELDLVDLMKAKLKNLIIAVNQADLVPEAQWPRLREHVRKRLAERDLPIPADRILFVSALNAETAIREGRLADPWVGRVRDLRSVVREHVLNRRGPLKAHNLAVQITDAVGACRRDVSRTVSHRKEQLSSLDRLEADHQRAREEHGRAENSIERATTKLRQHEPLRDALVSAFEEALPSILAGVGQSRDVWTSAHNPLSSPKKHVEEVSQKAIKSTQHALEAWFRGPGEQVLEAALMKKLDAAAKEVSDLAHYLQTVRGESAQDRAAFFEDIKERTLRDAYADATREASDVDAFGRSVVVAVAAVVVGYIVADVVLFYVLGAIAGFLAWPLLAAAVGISVILGSTKGDTWARAWVRDKIFEKISQQFSKDETQRKLRVGIDRAMRDVCVRIAGGFRTSCNQLLNEAHVQEQRVYVDLTKLSQMTGDRSALQAKVAEVDTAAAETLRACDSLEGITTEIRRGSVA